MVVIDCEALSFAGGALTECAAPSLSSIQRPVLLGGHGVLGDEFTAVCEQASPVLLGSVVCGTARTRVWRWPRCCSGRLTFTAQTSVSGVLVRSAWHTHRLIRLG